MKIAIWSRASAASHVALEQATAIVVTWLAAAFAVAAWLLATPATAQVLRDPPAPFGPLVCENSFADAAAAGVSEGLKTYHSAAATLTGTSISEAAFENGSRVLPTRYLAFVVQEACPERTTYCTSYSWAPTSISGVIPGFSFNWGTNWKRGYFWARSPLASGGNSRGYGALGTFYPSFPKKNYFNEASVQTAMNYMDVYPYVQIQPRSDLPFMAGIDILWRQNTRDSFYQPPGVPVVAGNANNKRFLRVALNLQAEWQVTPNLDVNTAFVHFIADGFLRAAGGKSITWTGAWAPFNF
jgi:hypothetical protein